ncbi:hypothetical protein K491DRAFT_85388 [Lophiostoma macrostomum CBS 122681]|uniref:Uncharacterized protein n=1 Tax=Lophiostoma macrostomum CBS 122681 TaxID=1314788 RepID=A0A6A6SV77_9PLEO|nr:hypothetical protein K491DRAFT_85388 [Lophiostoma macrostomum CBS 122681]
MGKLSRDKAGVNPTDSLTTKLSRTLNISSIYQNFNSMARLPLPFYKHGNMSRQKDPSAFPFLSLPRELREMIYDYFRQSDRQVRILYTQWGSNLSKSQEHLASLDTPVPHQPPATSGILAYYGRLPSLELRLTCKQVHAELWDHFLCATFEVGSLTPHDDRWRFDPTYQKLATSTRLSHIRKILVSIHVVDLRMIMHPDWGWTRYEDLDMETCVLKLQTLAEMLVRVLRKKAKGLRTVVVDWTDDFPDEDWEMKATVLYPFGTLKGVQMQLGRLIVAERGREKIRRMLERTLDGLSEEVERHRSI